MAIKAVLFDLDDTLLWDERSVEEAFAATCLEAEKRYPHVNRVRLEEMVRKKARELYESYPTFPFTQMIGINPFEALWAQFTEGRDPQFRELQALAPEYRRQSWTLGLQALGVEDELLGAELARRFIEERKSRPYVYEETFPVLDRLKGNVKLLLLTNGAPDLQREKLAGVPRLAGYFDHIVISGEYGKGKPDASIFQYALSLLGADPEESLMVGDKLTTDIAGANGVGIRSVWINRRNAERGGEIVPAYEIRNLAEIHEIIEQLES